MGDLPAVAVIDIGKSNAKLVLCERASGAVLDARSTPNETVRADPYPHYDVDGLWAWILEGLAVFARRAAIADIVPVAHGATAALVGDDGLALPVLDYEHDGPDEISGDYAALRPPFERGYSPSLPGGLNIGRQLYWQQARFAQRFAAVRRILAYPQYWSWRLCGVAASEVTSYGTHSDLWDVPAGELSELCRAQGWAERMPPFRKAWEVLGLVDARVVAATGLPAGCRVRCGVHDSNASLLPHLGTGGARSTVVSTGTWAITFSLGGGLGRLDERRDCLANVNVHGEPVPSARFMGGREHELLTAELPAGRADAAHLPALYDDEPAILPTLTPGVGPFATSAGGWVEGAAPGTAPHAAAGLYLAAMVATCRSLADGGGAIVLEGPFAENDAFVQALADLTGEQVRCMASEGGTVSGAMLLARELAAPASPPEPSRTVRPSAAGASARAYLERWRQRSSAPRSV